MTSRSALTFVSLIAFAGPLVGASVHAQTAAPSAPAAPASNRESLSVDQMLEQLAPAGRTRGMRNLVPVQVQPPAAPVAAPAAAPVAAPAAAPVAAPAAAPVAAPAHLVVPVAAPPSNPVTTANPAPPPPIAAPAPAPAPVAAPAVMPAPANQASAPAEPPLKIDLTIYFDLGSDRIQDRSRPLLDRLAMVMQHERARDLRFRIEGHTDAKGSALANELLSRRRAETVVRYLGSRGVDATRLAAEGKGFRELSDPANPLSEQNRRVSVVVVN
jgi:outer membrane protein OmpA-like peptidoglycan-associated protein